MSRAAIISLLGLLAGCASAPEPVSAPPAEWPAAPQGPVTPAPEPEFEREPEAPEEAAEPPRGAYGPKTVVIDPADAEDASPRSLSAAAEAERERRRTASLPIAVITDETLSEYAIGELTISGAVAPEPGPDEAVTTADGALLDDETYWRERALETRQAWRRAVEEIERLEADVAELRQRFYAEDDPYYRDSTIKPAWDRALDQLADTRRDAAESRQAVAELMDEGRRAGALPGWLREGIELEPEETRRERPSEHQIREPRGEHRSMEPDIVDTEDGGER